jgi:hypothetical protein
VTKVERLGFAVGGLLLMSGLVHVAILVISGGSWEGPTSLRKAATFGLSFGVTLITIVWVARWLPLSHRSRAALLGAFTAACVVETFLVSLQAWRGVPSHFNLETAFDAIVARSLAFGGAALVIIIGALTVAAFRSNPTVAPSLRVAIRVGFAALSASMVVGAFMIAKGMRLVLAGRAQAAYTTAGTLKPLHAVTMHGILVLPVLAWLVSRTGLSERHRVMVVSAAAGVYLVVVVVIGLIA